MKTILNGVKFIQERRASRKPPRGKVRRPFLTSSLPTAKMLSPACCPNIIMLKCKRSPGSNGNLPIGGIFKSISLGALWETLISKPSRSLFAFRLERLTRTLFVFFFRALRVSPVSCGLWLEFLVFGASMTRPLGLSPLQRDLTWPEQLMLIRQRQRKKRRYT